MASREFHFQDGASNKFWKIELEASSFTVHFGRIGTMGQTQTKEFSSAAEAKAACDKLIAEKVKKGYKEVTASKPAVAGAVARAPDKPAAPAPKPAAQASLLSQLPKRLQKELLEGSPSSRFTTLSIKEWLATCWKFEAFLKSAYEPRQTDKEIAALVASQAKQRPDWSPEQVRTALSVATVAQNPIDPIARRIVRDDPSELAVGVSISLRCSFIDVKLTELATGQKGSDHHGGGPLRPRQLLHALAAHDLQWAQQAADYDDGIPMDDEELALLAAWRRDPDQVRAHLPRGRVFKYDEWRWMCLRGITANDPELVRAGLQKELERIRGSRAAREEPGFGIVNLDVHGFYRLCQHVSPELVSTFDVRQAFPWDVEFHDWVDAHDNPLAGLEFADISPVLQDALVLLQLPAWWTSSETRPRPQDTLTPEQAQAFSLFGGLLDGLKGAFGGCEEVTDAAEPPETPPEYGLGSINDDMLPIAVSFEKLEAAIGSRDAALLNLLVEKFKDDLASDDRYIARQLEEGVRLDEDDHDEGDAISEASREGIRAAIEGVQERLQKGESLEQALQSIDKNADISEAHKEAVKELLGTLGDAVKRAEPEFKDALKNLKVGQVGQVSFNLDDDGNDEDETDEEDDEPRSAVSIAEILRYLIMSERPAGPVPYRYMYGCALRYLALHFGEVLPNERWNDFNSSAFRNIDKAMKAAGIPAKVVSLDRLVYRGAPSAAIPEYHEGLMVGYLRRNEVDQALSAVAAKLERVDEDHLAFVEDIHDWLRACADSKRDLLCFSVR
jgi:predicted DNA-binding WGR domain protein